jgi:NAD(P)-dependent dehydrogenase (short-subunit alcohol dehydrogenase family)
LEADKTMTAENGKAVFVYGDESSCEEICLHFARNGGKVGFVCRSDASASRLKDSIGPTGAQAVASVAERPGAEELSRAVIAVAEAFGGIDLLVFARRKPDAALGTLLLDLDESDWNGAMDEARAFFLICKYALPYLMNGENSGVVVIDGNGADATQSLPDLASGKALEAAAGRIADELSGYGVSVSYERIPDGEISRALPA